MKTIRDGDVIYVVQSSVEDPNVPLVSGRVRGLLTVAIWVLRPAASGAAGCSDVTYITHVNPNGTIPGSLLRLIATETPSCAGFLIADLAKKHPK
ncbi:hypothetical protein HK405_014106 [Cladochytrium tenue]|nr:hypothetical protein HK405_014106 [Cladochytrium tenue]